MKYYKSTAMLLSTLALSISACAATTHHLEGTIGRLAFTSISEAKHVSIVKISPERPPQYTPVSAPLDLTPKQIQQLRHYLLRDESYDFDNIKRCLFIPGAAYQFDDRKNTQVFVSFSCQKIKVVSKEKTSYIDYDPIAKEFIAFSETLLNKTTTNKKSP